MVHLNGHEPLDVLESRRLYARSSGNVVTHRSQHGHGPHTIRSVHATEYSPMHGRGSGVGQHLRGANLIGTLTYSSKAYTTVRYTVFKHAFNDDSRRIASSDNLEAKEVCRCIHGGFKGVMFPALLSATTSFAEAATTTITIAAAAATATATTTATAATGTVATATTSLLPFATRDRSRRGSSVQCKLGNALPTRVRSAPLRANARRVGYREVMER